MMKDKMNQDLIPSFYLMIIIESLINNQYKVRIFQF